MKLARRIAVHFLPSLFAAGLIAAAQAQSFVNFEGKQTQPIRLSPDGTRLFAVNTPDARLSVFEVSNPSNPLLIAEIPVGLEPVSVNPRNNDEVWVVNEVSDSVSIVSVSRHVVTDTLQVKDEPADVVFAAGKAFVTTARRNEVRVFDATNHTSLASIPLLGENPRALTVNSNGTRVYAAFALSGNRTTLIASSNAPPQPPPTNGALPPPPLVGLIVDAADPAWSPSVIKYTMPDNDVVEIDTAALTVLRYFSRVGTVNFAIAVRPGSGDLYVANTDARNLVRFEPNVRGHIVDNRIARISAASGTVVTNFDLNPGIDYTKLPNLSARSNALAQPTAIVFGPSGNNFYLASFGTDRIARMDAENGAITARIEIGPAIGSLVDPRNKRGPRGLALGPPGSQRLYVLNRISNTISVVDTVNNVVQRELPCGSHDPTPAVIRNGRGFLYDAKLSGNGTVSCSACHVDAEMDLIAWDLGNPGGDTAPNISKLFPGGPPPLGTSTDLVHPMKGPMTTQTLRGLKGAEPFHWRGDRTNFLHFNGAFSSLLGGSILADADMQAYRDFINTIVFEPNPNQNLDRTLPAAFANGDPNAGLYTFLNETYAPTPAIDFKCSTCHALPLGTTRTVIAGLVLQESQDFKVPQLRSVYQKINYNRYNTDPSVSLGGFGLAHDGVDLTLFKFLSRPMFRLFSNDTTRKQNLEAFLMCFDTGMAPAVGYTRTVTAANANSAAAANDWTLLEGQAATTNIDLIVKGTIDGKLRGLLYRPGSNDYLSDRSGTGPFNRAQLLTKVLAGDTLSLMGVPPGSGARLGVDRDENGVLDGDVASPNLRIARANTNAIISWSTNAAGFLLEASPGLPATNWSPDTSPRGVSSGEFNVTNRLSSTNGFFRLRQL